MDIKSQIEKLKNNPPMTGGNQRECGFNDGYDYALRKVLALTELDVSDGLDEIVIRMPPVENTYDPKDWNEVYKKIINHFNTIKYDSFDSIDKHGVVQQKSNLQLEKEVVSHILSIGGKLTSSFHPECDMYTLITDKHFSISPTYKMVDVWNIGEYPVKRSLGRAWYKNIEGLKIILETGKIIDQRF